MSPNRRQPGRGKESIKMLRDGAVHAVRKDGVGANRREEADDIGPDPC